MPADRAAMIRCLVALAVLCGVSLALFSAASRDHRQLTAVVRATPSQAVAPAMASIEGRP
jgi:hypothetical protein